MADQLRLDPSRTGFIRKAWIRETNKRFRWLAKQIRELIVRDDVLGLKKNNTKILKGINVLASKQAWKFNTDAQKVTQFQGWLNTQVNTGVLSTGTQPPWSAEYVDSAYKKGLVNSYAGVNSLASVNKNKWYQGGQQQFLQDAFAQPEMMSKIELIYTRAYSELKGVTAVMEQQLSRSLAAGLANGDGPAAIARTMNQQVASLNKTRARVIARTETAYAHAEGQLDGFEKLGITEVGLKAEWMTAADACPLCAPLNGAVLSIKEAHNLIPYHPNCRCAWAPVLEDSPQPGQLWGKDRDYAVYKSFKQGGGIKKSTWFGKTKFKASGKSISGKKTPIVKSPVPPPSKATKKASGKLASVKKKKKSKKVSSKQQTAGTQSQKPPRKPSEYTKIGVKGVNKHASMPTGMEFKVLDNNIGGSTGAKLVEVRNPKTGEVKKFVMKAYRGNEAQVQNEYVANRIYQQMGAGVPETHMGMVGNKRVLFTEYVDDMKSLKYHWSDAEDGVSKAIRAEIRKDISKQFTTDAWLANWDVIGLEMDNMGYAAKGKYKGWVRIDNGGSLLYRAQGGPKGPLFNNVADELVTMRSSKNISANTIFGKMSDKDLISHLEDFEIRYKKVRPELRKIIQNSGMDKTASDNLLKTMRLRASSMKDYRKELIKKTKQAERTAKTTKPKSIPKRRVAGNKKDLNEDQAFTEKILNTKEKQGIHSYTGNGYSRLNYQAVNDKLTQTHAYIDRGLLKTPGYDGYVARGVKNMKPEVFQNVKSGEWAYIEWKSFSSSSAQAGREFGSRNGICYIVKQKGRQGSWVRPISSHPTEDEVLFMRNAKFRVRGIAEKKAGQGKQFGQQHDRLVYLEEVPAGTAIPESQMAPKVYDYDDLYQKFFDNSKKNGFNPYYQGPPAT